MKYTILHLEDNEIYSSEAKKLFSRHHYLHFDNAESALEYLIHNRVDIIISDGKLPGAWNGMEFVRRFRLFNKKTPIIACSNGFNRNLMEAGANVMMNKDRLLDFDEDGEALAGWLNLFKELVHG